MRGHRQKKKRKSAALRHLDAIPHRAPPGTPPGTLIADPEAPAPVIRVMAFGPDAHMEMQLPNAKAVAEHLGKWPVIWVNVDGLGDADTLRVLGSVFDLHRLALEDVINVRERPKVESYERHHFVVVRMVHLHGQLQLEQLSLFVGPDFVVTFQERPGDCLDPVRQRIRTQGMRVREGGADGLAYAILDAVVDSYYPILEEYGDRLDRLEDDIMDKQSVDAIARIHETKRDLRSLRRNIWPLREVFGALYREKLPLIADETRVYFRDSYDHCVQLIDLIETYRELCSDLTDVHLSVLSNRANEIMKVLTIIATVFIPLTFIAGIYGMNFDPDVSVWNMPELRSRFGYPFSLLLMLVTTLVMLAFFRRKGWLGGSRSSANRENSQQ